MNAPLPLSFPSAVTAQNAVVRAPDMPPLAPIVIQQAAGIARAQFPYAAFALAVMQMPTNAPHANQAWEIQFYRALYWCGTNADLAGRVQAFFAPYGTFTAIIDAARLVAPLVNAPAQPLPESLTAFALDNPQAIGNPADTWAASRTYRGAQTPPIPRDVLIAIAAYQAYLLGD